LYGMLLPPPRHAFHLLVLQDLAQFQHYHMNDSPEQTVQELLHQAAFGEGTALGRPLLCPLDNVHLITADTLRSYRAQHFTPDRIVLAAAGVDHGDFVRYVDKHLGSLQPSEHRLEDSAALLTGSSLHGDDDGSGLGATRASSHSAWPRPSQEYKGGMVTWNNTKNNGQPLEFTHLVMAFPTVGWTSEDVVPMCVLDTLLGGGSSFSAGGPGKGMYSRLFRQVLNSYSWVEAANAFTLQFDHHGLFGMYGAAEGRDLGLLVSVLTDQLKALRRASVTPVELSRARNQLSSSVMMNLEMKAIQCEDIGRQILVLNKRLDPTELVRRIQAVTAEDIQRVATAALSQPPSVAVLGDVERMPSYEQLVESLKTDAPSSSDSAGLQAMLARLYAAQGIQ
jgi:processing peptidase subunit alpha